MTTLQLSLRSSQIQEIACSNMQLPTFKISINSKQANPFCTIKYADITPYVRQNCGATACVLTSPVIEALCTHVPGSQTTQLYFLASTSIREPFCNNKLGPPTSCRPQLMDGDHDLEMMAEVCSVDRGADPRVKFHF